MRASPARTPSMSTTTAWILLSFAIMVVAVLARLSDTVEKLERRLEQLERPRAREDERA